MVGIDKLSLTTTEFSLQRFDSQYFGLASNKYQGGTGEIPKLLTTNEGEVLRGQKIWRNVETQYSSFNYTINKLGLCIVFNPSKMHHLYHLSGTGKPLLKSMDIIKGDLLKVGLDCSLENMKFSRIDISNQQEMSKPPHQYLDVFKLLNGKRSKSREYPSESYYVGNKSWHTVGYDKFKELKDNKLAGMYEGERNLFRIENKYLSSKYVNSKLPFNKLVQLVDVEGEELHSIYKEQLLSTAFNRNLIAKQTVLDFKEEADTLRYLISNHSTTSNAVLSHIINSGGTDVETYILSFGGMDKFRQWLSNEVGIARRTSYNVMKTIERVMRDNLQINSSKRVTVLSLYEEILEKFAA